MDTCIEQIRVPVFMTTFLISTTLPEAKKAVKVKPSYQCRFSNSTVAQLRNIKVSAKTAFIIELLY